MSLYENVWSYMMVYECIWNGMDVYEPIWWKKNYTNLADILRYVLKNPVRRLHLIAALLNF